MAPPSSSALKSDLALDAAKFDPDAVTAKTQAFNEKLVEIMAAGPKWWDVGAERYRQMRWDGETPLPKPVVLPEGRNLSIPSREQGRTIPCRVFEAEGGRGKAKGVFCHIHGGGWVLQSERYQDVMLKYIGERTGLTVVSVGYRLAPEHPYPAANEDCHDAAAYLIAHSTSDFGGPLLFLGGDSAGAHLSVATCLRLQTTHPTSPLHGLILNFGAYDLSNLLPQSHNYRPSPSDPTKTLVLDGEIMQKYIEAYIPDSTVESRRKDPYISPLYADLSRFGPRGALPSALFTCGTADPLLDDSVFMCAKWVMGGSEGILKIYPGAPHGFVFFPLEGGTETTGEGLEDIVAYMKERI
ncbi:alpha/beta hydrolase fold [Teratosphaeria destructans]|uniref:Alpha/beta hydrolase fold n=1 Tax=Teratosphaeria destructans TaxID=418781 RepID=A0A9W7W2W7_9PEZI|nr:alpha/beta hydrolase fold [Teratosphaeria destructans]